MGIAYKIILASKNVKNILLLNQRFGDSAKKRKILLYNFNKILQVVEL